MIEKNYVISSAVFPSYYLKWKSEKFTFRYYLICKQWNNLTSYRQNAIFIFTSCINNNLRTERTNTTAKAYLNIWRRDAINQSENISIGCKLQYLFQGHKTIISFSLKKILLILFLNKFLIGECLQNVEHAVRKLRNLKFKIIFHFTQNLALKPKKYKLPMWKSPNSSDTISILSILVVSSEFRLA